MTHQSCDSSLTNTAVSSLVGLARQRAQYRPDHPAYVFLSGDQLSQSRLTYSELDLRARSIAGVLQGLKARGERALLLYPPGLEFIAAFFGCLYAGAIAVPAYPPRLNRNALRIVSIAQDSQASLILTTNAVLLRLDALAAHAPELAKLRWFPTDNLQAPGGDRQDFYADGQALAYLQYTSGSTAAPKGVMISHANVLDNSAYLAKAFRHSAEDISLSWLPHFHDLGLVHGILQPMYSCFPGYLIAPMSFLQRPLDWLRAISRFRVTHSDGPNFAYALCVDKITSADKKDLDLGSWRMALNGAEPVFPETIERFSTAFAACGFKRIAFYPAYGLAEATLVVSGGKKGPDLTYCSVVSSALEQNKVLFADVGAPGARTLVASGCFAPPMQVEIVDPESCRKCAQDTIGEIWVAGPSRALGYWKQPEETERVFGAALAHDSEHTFLRTGDLGFILDGNLFITGRLKELIIIRGRNHYPQDIERTARESCPEILFGAGTAFSVTVGTEERLVLIQELKRRQKVDVEQFFRRARAAILEEHEVQVHEIALVHAGSIPKTSSGKTQRGLCRKEFLEGTLQVISRSQAEAGSQDETVETGSARPPDAEDIQVWLRSRIASRIGIVAGEIDVHRPLLHLGMDSLNAVALAHDVEARLGIVWQAATFLEDVTVRELARRAAEQLEKAELRKEIKEIHVPGRGTKTEYPLSFGQQGLWFLHQLSPESSAYNIVQAITIRSSVDVQALRRSLQALVDRYGSLRTTFAISDGKPVQRLHEKREVWFHCESVQQWDSTQLHERLRAEAHAPFNLEQGPLFRIHLFSRSAGEHVLLLTAHHIIIDLWSFAQVMAELGVLYGAAQSGRQADLPPATSDYSRFVDWQKDMLASDEGRSLWSYWSRQLSRELPVLELPVDRPRPSVQRYRGSSCPFRLPRELTDRLRSVSQDCDATLYMTLLAAFQVLLHRYTGEGDIVVGSPTAGRSRAEFASIVGYFVNPVVLRATVSPGSTFRSFLSQRVRKTVLEAVEHQDYPFSLLTEKLQPVRDPRRSPLFQIMFAMQKAQILHDEGLSLFALGDPAARINLGGLEMQCMALEQRIAQFDLSLIMAEAGGGLAATFEYNTDLFDFATIRRMMQHFEILLQSIATDPDQEIASLRLWAGAEGSIHATLAGPSRPALDTPVQALYELQAARTPDAPAIIFEGQQLNYRELNERANQLARYLAACGVLPGWPVAVRLERSPEMIVSLLAVFKAGAVYVPIDPEYPKQRLDFVVEDARVKVLITGSHLAGYAPREDLNTLCLGMEDPAISRQSTLPLSNRGDAQAPAYIIYTSGSTGNPKGVLVGHRALSNHMQWLAAEFPLSQNDRVLNKYSSSFDASLAEILYPLITGAALVIARAAGQYDPGYLVALMREHRVTAIDAVPTMLKVLMDDTGITRCQDLRQIISGGEALSVDLKELLHERLGKVELVNMYGPTEATITTSFHRCRCGQYESPIAIGTPIANAVIYLLDRSLRPVPAGVVGDIYIGGEGLAWGYLNQPQLTAEKFIPDPFGGEAGARLYATGDLGRCRQDGTITYLGRADTQTKIRGFRIELGEIEAELRKHSHIKSAVAAVRVRPGGDKYIAAYVEHFGDRSVTAAQLRTYLMERLPEHMLPAAIVVMQGLPLLPSGKPDIRALSDPEGALPAPELAQPGDHFEQELLAIWQELLGRKDIGIHSNFFELGGDSILGIQVVARARDVGVELAPRQIFQFQTIAGLARVAGTTPGNPEFDTPVEGPVSLTPIQRWFFEQDLKNPEHYSQSLIVQARERLDLQLLEEAMQHLMMRHPALRLRFDRTPQGWRQTCASRDGSDAIGCVSVHHLPAEQQSTNIEAKIEAMTGEIRAGLNLARGPIMGIACFDLGASRPQRLSITVHHLAIDVVSLRILLDDLQQVYERLKRGEIIALPRRTFSFQRWSELLADHAQSEEVRREAALWTAKLSLTINRLPVDHDGENTADSSRTLLVSLPPEETSRLLHEVPRAYRTEINDALLAALAQTLARWSKTERVLIDLEGHGREEVVEGADISGTVGWFTAQYPVLLESENASDPGQVLKSVKEQLRTIPNKGIGYGLLRYLCADETLSAQLRKMPGPEVSFNYLGQLQLSPSSGLFELVGLIGPAKSSIGRRTHLLEIDGYIKDGSLQIQWTYSSQVHSQDTIQRVASDFIDDLRALVQHCVTRKTSESSPSDFPLVHITRRQLAALEAIHRSIEDVYPLSPMQQGMLFHSLYETRKGTYLTQLVCELSGALNQEALQAAWQQVVDNYSALRTAFEWEIVTDEPVQVVRRKADLKWRRDDWSAFPAEQQERFLDAYLTDDRKREMDLRQPPLMRFALVKTGESRHLFLWSCHHLLMDGWSLPTVFGDVFRMYESLCNNKSLRVKSEYPYRDYIAWLNRRNPRSAEDFWRRRMHGFAVPTSLQSLRQADAGTLNSDDFREYEVLLPEARTRQLHAFARQHHLTLSTITYGVWALLLSRITGKNDVVFGTVVSGRQMSLAGANAMVGMLINTLPMRAKLEPGNILSEWLQRLQEQQSEAAQFEHYPLSSIQSCSDVPRGVLLFDCIVVFENYPASSWSSLSKNLEITKMRSFERSNYPITLWIIPEQQLRLRIGYDAHVLNESKMMRLLDDYRQLLEEAGVHPHQKIGELLNGISSSSSDVVLRVAAVPGKSAAEIPAKAIATPASAVQKAAAPPNENGTMAAAVGLADDRRGKEKLDS